jgi:hypothetical protein
MRVLVRMENGMLGAFNRDTAKLEWAYRLKAFGARFGGPAITETAVLAAASDGTITCLSTDAPDIDGPTFALPTPAGYETGLVGRGTLRFIGATVDDDGSGVAPGSVTLSLDGQDLTKYLQWNGRTGAYTIELSPANPIPAGVHRLLMTAKDMRGNLGTLSHAFIAADGTGERVSVTINGECVPRTLAVAPGTVVVWLNQSGGPRTVVAAGGAFTSDALYPTGIPAGDVWVWIVPADAKPGARYPYTDRLTGRGGELTVE